MLAAPPVARLDRDACRTLRRKSGVDGGVERELDVPHQRARPGVFQPRRLECGEAHAAVRERGGDEIRGGKARLGRGRGLGDPGDLERRAVAPDAHARDLARGHAHFLLQRERAVDRGEGVAATGVVLEGHLADVEVFTQRRQRALPIGPFAHRPSEPGFAFDDVERPGDAFRGAERRADARLGGAAGVHRLGHGVRPEGLLQAGGEGGDRGERVREAAGVEPEHLGGGARRAEAADRAGVVPVLVVRAAHRLSDARRYFVADDHRAQEGLARRAARLRNGERRGDGRRAGMVDAFAEDVVDFGGMRRRAVDDRGRAHARAPPVRQPGAAFSDLLGERTLEQRGGRNDRAGEERRVPVDHGALGVVQDLGRQGPRALPLRPLREALDDAHHCGAAIPASFISFDHFAWSSRMKRANSWGVSPEGSAPRPSIFSRTSRSASTRFASAEIFATVACGVAAGASSPNQPTAS
jgi:hypothetical protein